MKKINFEHISSYFKVVSPVEMSKITGGDLLPGGDDRPGCYWGSDPDGNPINNFYWDGTYPVSGDFMAENDPRYLC